MLRIKGKKGQFLLYGLIAGLIAALVIAFISSATDKKEFPVIGKSSLRLIDASIKAEKALLYIDQSAKYPAHQIIYDLAKVGGCNDGKKYSGYILWDINDRAPTLCTPSAELSKKIFLKILPDKIDDYLSKYEPVDLSLINYLPFDLDNNNLIGIAEKPLEIPIIVPNPDLDPPGAYSIRPSFNVDISYDFSDYDELRVKAEELIETCKNNDPFKCIGENLETYFNQDNFELIECETPDIFFEFLDFFPEVEPEPGYRSKIYRFCVNRTIDRFYTYDVDDDMILPRNIVYKFALKFEDIACHTDDSPKTQCREFACDQYFRDNDPNAKKGVLCQSLDTTGPPTNIPINPPKNPLLCYCPPNTGEGPIACAGDCPRCACTEWETQGEPEACGQGLCSSVDLSYTRECRHSSCGLDETDCRYECQCDECCPDHSRYDSCDCHEIDCPPPPEEDDDDDDIIPPGGLGDTPP